MKRLIQIILIALVVILSHQSISAQAGSPLMPYCNAIAKNFALTGASTFEFDVFLSNTGEDPFNYATAQYAFNFNTAVLQPGATLTMTLVSNTSQIPSAIRPNNFLTYPSTGILYITARVPVVGLLTIAESPLETRVGRFKVESSLPYLGQPLNLTWRNSTIFPETILVYTDDPDVGNVYEITDNHVTFSVTGGDIVLPVELSSFNANVNQRDVNLRWQTKTEVNSNSFQIERTVKNKQSWVKVGEVVASGNSNSPKEYSFTDKNINSGKYNYRLKMIDNDGTYKYSDAIESEVALPKDYAVSQNYPNPFNPTTRIDYQLPFDSRVTIELYGITGERVATIINGELSAGYYTTDVNASALNLASGVYIYRISAQNSAEKDFVQVKKLMLTK